MSKLIMIKVSILDAEQILPARDDFPDANLTFKGIKGSDLNKK